MKIIIVLYLISLAWIYDHTAHAAVRVLHRTLKPIPVSEEIRRNNKTERQDEFFKLLQESISDEELLIVSDAMFKADDNNAFKKIKVNIQANTTSYSKKDEAPNNLLTIPEYIWKGPTVAPLVALFDNYYLNYAVPETETPEDEMEQVAYIKAILATRPMNILMNFLVKKGVTYLKDHEDQLKYLKKIWFTKYSRQWTNFVNSSCAFEYTFMSESYRGSDIGLHSWIYYATRETAVNDTANYLGYVDKVDLDGKGMILKHSSMMGDDRPVLSATTFIGTSPELETALYTLCFMGRPNQPCNLRYHNVTFTVQTKPLRSYYVRLIDTAHPVL